MKELIYKVHEYRIKQVWRRFEDAGFKPVLIKGWWAAQFYTEPSERRFNDIDLIINPDEYDKAVELAKKFEVIMGVDLHCGARHLDSLDFKTLFAKSKIVKCGDTSIRVLCPEDHLRVLCVHWLIDGGANRERLRDIFYAVENRPADFDWERCLDVCGETRKRWIICTLGLANKYLGLNLEDTPLAGTKIEIPEWLIKSLEKEWANDVKIVPLHYCLNDWTKFKQQIKKRIPPNPIQATVEMEGKFDNRTRVFYQTGDFFYRLVPSLKRVKGVLLSKFKK
ncbi:MAG: nucleotidyltransferase family protein [Pyrinomonadaceae bacterium]